MKKKNDMQLTMYPLSELDPLEPCNKKITKILGFEKMF